MQHVFLSIDGRCRDSWKLAFPQLTPARLDAPPAGDALLWALQPAGQDAGAMAQKLAPISGGRRLIVLADEPSEDGALAAFAGGAAGYCNGHAAPQVLRQVGEVVANGGLWIGQNLMQRLLSATARLQPAGAQSTPAWSDRLTPREYQTARLVAQGASNKEIARRLEITERTAKAHVGALLEKLGARDRLQLSLILNGIDAPR